VSRIATFIYGLLCYAVFMAVTTYGIGFIGGFITPTQLDGAPSVSLGQALAIDLGLLALFAVQHSGMARPAFKRWWTRIVPEPAERSTYVLLSSVLLAALFAWWQPLGGVIWEAQGWARIDTGLNLRDGPGEARSSQNGMSHHGHAFRLLARRMLNGMCGRCSGGRGSGRGRPPSRRAAGRSCWPERS